MKQKDTLKEILQKYRLQQPVSPGSRKRMAGMRRETLVKILKEKGKYGLLIVPVLKMFYFSRRIGIPLSMTKSAIAAATALAISAGTVSVGTYYTIRYVQHILEAVDHKEPVKPAPQRTNSQPVKPEPYRLAIKKFKSYDGESIELADHLQRDLQQKFNERQNIPNTAIMENLKTKAMKDVKYILLGSIIRFGKSYRVSGRLVERETSMVVMYASETVEGKDQLDKAVKTIADKVAGIF